MSKSNEIPPSTPRLPVGTRSGWGWDVEVRQPHRTKSRGLTGEGKGNLTASERAGRAVEAGTSGRVGLTAGAWTREKRVPSAPPLAPTKRHSALGKCLACRFDPGAIGLVDVKTGETYRYLDGDGLCVVHAAQGRTNPGYKRLWGVKTPGGVKGG